ncbi:MAG: glycosyltransferase family 25 protein [Chlamydiia bacterium]
MPDDKTTIGLNRFEKILYINLDHRLDRKNALLEELARVKVDPNRIIRIEAVHEPLNGHRGCALSHIKAIEYAQKNQLREVLILEDDAFFSLNAEQIEEHLSYFAQSVSHFDVLLLGGRIELYQEGSIPRIFRAKRSRLAHAYVVKEHYYKTLLAVFCDTYKKLLNIPFFSDAKSTVIDRTWDPLFEKDLFLFTEIFAYQRESFSDIQHRTCGLEIFTQ